ncbi:non-ribosomal peptide synthetase, partial [Clostridium botulinum]|uniref:non-ribosomal peptide synthetase n=1 Tax=Clostridium botulinum TaxID=1491 RepID=UPI001FD6CDBF
MGQNNKLDKNNIENFMSLTSLQQGMLFHYISDEESNMYHEQLSLTLRGGLKLELLQRAWQFVIDSNEMLRTIFRWKEIEKPIQVVLKRHEVPINYLDFTNEVDKKGLIKQVKLKDLNNRIDITRETLRIYLCKIGESTHEMIISNHHILYDGWSNGIILKEVMEVYNCLYEGKEPKKLNKTRFSEFIKYLNSINKEDEKKYWPNYLGGLDSKDDYFNCKEVGVHKEISYKIENFKANKIKDFSKENKILLSSILYGAWGVLLQKFNNSNEVLFGTTVSGRPENISSIDKMVGLFINTIPLRVKTDEKTTLMGLIKSLDESFNERKGFENAALTDIKEYCGLKVNEELFNSIVTIENYPLDLSSNKENVLSIEEFSIVEQTNYNMALEILTFDGIEFKFNFNSLSIDESIVEKFGIYLGRIIENLLNNPNISIENIDLLSEAEKNQILYEFNDTKADYPMDKTIHELFEAQVEKTPDNVAVVFEDKKLTYRELNERANSLARVLRDKGVKADSIVGIMVERSLEMIVGIMGILKAGGAYLPIDPNYPKERIEYMLKDSNSKILLSENTLVESIHFNGEFIDLFNEEIFMRKSENLDKTNDSDDLMYIIYTSGTTGKPKGTMIEHRSVVNLCNYHNKTFSVVDKDKSASYASFSFDACVWEIWPYLIIGASLYIIGDSIRLNMKKLNQYYENNGITISFLPTQVCENFLQVKNSSLRILLTGGDKLKHYIENNFKVINNYGPTESTVVATSYEVSKDLKNIPIGKPINNANIYILDNARDPISIGIAGEIYISGDGLARGYLNIPELTAEKFIDNPFEPGTKMYKTGDLARWLPDGNIEFLGRIDNQVKIRGFRIELGEIENRLLQHENIKEAAVLVKENKDSEKYICAYVVSEKNLEELDLKSHLKETLPEYMVPAYFVELEKMPLTANGKLNRRAFPEPNLDESLTEYEAPRNKVEETLAKIWSKILGVEKIGINDNFFDLGGHSLKATILMSKIHKELNREVPLKELFKSATIKDLSKYIESAEENLYSKIEKVEEKEYYEASSAQKRMYMLQQFDKDSTAYNMPAVFELEGKVDKDKIEETFRKLTERHEALRTYFETAGDEIVQKIDNNYEFKLNEKISHQSIEQIVNDFIKSFDLGIAPLFRAEIFKTQGKKYLLIDIHHIISDGVSMSILINEFASLYSGNKLEPLELQYKDFAAWQNNFLKSDEMKKQEEYWRNVFSDEIPVLNMPYDYERPAVQSFEGNSVSFKVNKNVAIELKELTKKTGTTMHMVLLSAFNILLSKYSGQEDIVVGTPIAGRPHADLQNIMGMFVNTLALRNKPEGNKKYIDFLNEVKENSLEAYENQSYQLEALIEELDIRRDTSRNPLFDVMFNMVDTVSDVDIELNDMSLIPYGGESNVAKFDLTLSPMEQNDEIAINIGYCSKLFNKNSIERLGRYYLTILEIITTNNEVKLGEIELLSNEEKNKLLNEFNDTNIDYPKNKTIQELFELQVEKTPDNIAVVFEDKELTYKELNEKSNQLARVLRDKGVKADTIVAIMLDRSVEMVISIMAILKAGGAYLPIDPGLPEERIKYIMTNSKSRILLSEQRLIKGLDVECKFIDLNNRDLFDGEKSNIDKINNSSNLAYVIYTSGTTGNPKGVMIEHRNLNNLILGLHKNIYNKYKENLKICLLAPYYFDASVKQIFAAILNGHSLYIVDEETRRDGKKLLDYYEENEIQVSDGTPMHIKMMLNNKVLFEQYKLKIKEYIVGGEELNLNVIKEFCESFTGESKPYINNVYGPTECCVDSSIYVIDCEKVNNIEIIPIGKPMVNYKLYIIDKYNKLLSIGVPGELCISGDGVARGYLNNLELTELKFVDNPFEPGTKMYKTGDLARWLPDGNLEFLGRIDNQVKIRGFRIELGEIENKLLQHKDVKEAKVIVIDGKDEDKHICSYIVSEKELNELSLKDYLKKSLAEYMIPSYFVKLNKMPITPNGKFDRRALPEPNLDAGLVEYEAPRNKVEETLAKIWSEILGIEKVGINDNFFDLGGHSLKATILMSKIHKELNKEVPLKELFKSPTIKDLSNYIESAEENLYSKIEKVEEKEYYEASSAQKRMYMLQQFDKDSTAYNMPAVFELEGKVDKDKIEETFRKLTERHEALRTYFETLDGEIIQVLQNNHEFKLQYRNISGSIEDILNVFVRPFDLGKAPLFRIELIENKEKIYLLMNMHHIISDGLSMSILINDFTEVYGGKTLEPLKLQYKDFAAWQNNFLKSKDMKKQEEYWINRFSDEIPVLNIPTDYERPAMQSFEGDNVSFEVNEDITLKLRKLTRETGTTMHMVLLSAFNILLSKYSGQEDIVIGTPIAGRSHVDLQNIMGMFVNTLALRNKPEANKKYIGLLKEVKENSLEAYKNQSYQLEALVEKLDIRRDTSRNPLFDVMFNMIDTVTGGDIKLEDIILKAYNNGSKISKFDLTLNALESDRKLNFTIEYCSKLFKKETIERLSNHYIRVLESIVNNVEIKLSEIDLLSEAERNQILYEFNDTKADYPKNKTIHELFQAQVEKAPNNIAVVFEDKKLTYRELNERANSLAMVLRGNGVKADSIVGIMVERSLEMIVGIMAILKAGGAYLPIDPNYPKERIEYMLKDSGSNILLSKSDLVENIEFDGEFIDLYNEEIFKNNITNLPRINNS